MYEQTKVDEEIPIYLITDQTYRNRHLFKDILVRAMLPSSWYESGAVVKADSIEELAGLIGVDASKLEQTLNRFNSQPKWGEIRLFWR